jgi:opacity protein-like surface antigen
MVVEDSYIHHTATTGVYFKGGAADVVIQRNRIEEAGQAGILVGFDTSVEFFDLRANPNYYEAIRGTVRNNYVKGTAYAGIGLYAAKDAVVANNTIVDAAREGHAALYFGVTFQDWDPNAKRPPNINPRLLNNLVVNGSDCMAIRYSDELGGLSGLSGSPGSDYNGFASTCRFEDGRPGSVLSNGTLAQWRSSTKADSHSLSGNFSVDAKGHLPSGSAAINKGTVVAQVADDIDKQPRLSSYDIGADEYGQASAKPIARNGSRPLLPPHGGGNTVAAESAGAPSPRSGVAAPAPSPPDARTPPVADTAKPRQVRITPPLIVAWYRFLGWLDRTGFYFRTLL